MTILLAVLLAQIVAFEPPKISSVDIASLPRITVAQGHVAVVTLSPNACLTPIIIREKEFRCRPDNTVLVGIPADLKSGVYSITTSGNITVAALDVTDTTWLRVQRTSGVTGPPPPAGRLLRDREAKNVAFSAHASPQWHSYILQAPLVLPISTDFRITDPFGLQRVYGKRASVNIHYGVDLAPPVGGSWQQRPPSAQSMASGVVTLATYLWLEGNTVIVYHGDGVYTAYCHLSKITVQRGTLVSAGQQLGLIGSTGRSSGTHLHLTFRVHGVSVDPLLARIVINSAIQ